MRIRHSIFLYATFGMSIFAAASDGALLDVWLGFPSHGSGRRGSQSESTRWAALDELVSRQPHPRGPLYLRLALLLEHPSRRRTRASDRCVPRDRRAAGAVRRAAAVALIRLSGAAPHARAALPERLQSAISRGEREREREREREFSHTHSSHAPPMHLPCTSHAPPVHLPCISHAPPMHLPCTTLVFFLSDEQDSPLPSLPPSQRLISSRRSSRGVNARGSSHRRSRTLRDGDGAHSTDDTPLSTCPSTSLRVLLRSDVHWASARSPASVSSSACSTAARSAFATSSSQSTNSPMVRRGLMATWTPLCSHSYCS